MYGILRGNSESSELHMIFVEIASEVEGRAGGRLAQYRQLRTGLGEQNCDPLKSADIVK